MSYLTTVTKLYNNAKDKSEEKTILGSLVTKLTSLSPNKSTSYTSTAVDDSVYVSEIRSFIRRLQSMSYDTLQKYETSSIKSVISTLSGLLPTPVTRNAIINTLKKLNSQTPLTFFNYNSTMTTLKNTYGSALDTNIADDVLKDFITANM